MITHELLRDEGILIATPEGPLTETDFAALAATVDPYIEESGGLRGLLIDAPSFPGWESFAGLVAHLRFVRDHHRHIAKIAAVTDGRFLAVVPKVADHFVSAEIKHFDSDAREDAFEWLRDA